MPGKYCYDWPRAAVTADVCALSRDKAGRWHVLLIRRANPPFQGQFALPGGFLDVDREDLQTTARRELREETGLEAPADMPLVGIYSKPGRDPRGHTVTGVWLALYDWPPPRPVADDDAAEAVWAPADTVGALAFDHDRVLADALALARCIVRDASSRTPD